MEKEEDIIKLKATKVEGQILAPPSKSCMQRLLCAALLSEGETNIFNSDNSEDSQNALKLIQQAGAKITDLKNNRLQIIGGININDHKFNVGESGLGIRMFAPVLAIADKKIELDGEGSLKSRPLHTLIDALQQCGVYSDSSQGHIPLKMSGMLKAGEINIDGQISSQVLTGFLMALPCAKGDSKIFVKNLKSKPYIDLTIEVLNKFGIQVANDNYEIFSIPGTQKYKETEIVCEGDWSSISTHLIAAAIGGRIEINGINVHSKQADIKILQILQQVGAKIEVTENKVIVEKNDLRSFYTDATDFPDLFPGLVMLGAYCNGTSVINGVERLFHKESNRAEIIKREFSKMGINIEISENKIIVSKSKIKNAIIDPHNDHRIAMAASLAAITPDTEIIITQSNCVKKSYPNFFTDFKNIIK